MRAFNQRIQARLDEREAKGLTRSLLCLDGANTSAFKYQGCEKVNFSSNDYLGLASDHDMVSAWQDGLDKYGAGSAASPLVTGFSSAHQMLEDELCDWLGYSRAILFGSGFSANQSVLFSLLEKGDSLFQDRLNHASLVEAGMLSPARMQRFRHNDVSHLKKQLIGNASPLVVTEGVFSMDGDLAPLTDLSKLCNTTESLFMVDDAHGVGVLGADGRGSCDFANVEPDILVVTFGKAFGLSGAAVMCGSEMGAYLTQFARHHVYSTAIPPSQAYALTHCVNKVRSESWRRDKLSTLQQAYNDNFSQLPGYVETITPIKPLMVGEASKAVLYSDQLKQAGFWTTAIRPPTVPTGEARLRITLTANHCVEDVRRLANALKPLVED
ncbi:8-amino-7-oxononanoate synthase [Vibrio tapetis subsp. quintayensis]|uniref:8-amino-7-oxononanoate synthase n=1 Tax=Vibrio tapetis TaxID=52443 RepID=UPI0025B28B74|nr:8-amino-7-oxononanoate synthase [Vibrio tapetis]MDN3682355.1 8-amino-7-oxononanoate synthase [Vibrio tapetis subsp. quintayensis]